MEPNSYAFVSYSTQNQNEADALRRIFHKQGIPTWMAPYDIPSGGRYAAVLNDALKGCGCLVLLLSEASQNSNQVDREVERAIAYRKPIVPVQIEDVVLNSAFEYYIGSCQIVAVREIDENASSLWKVMDGVRSFLHLPSWRAPVQYATEAERKYRAAAEAGDAEAQYHLGECFDQGEDAPENAAEAVRWYKMAALQGHMDAQYSLGLLYNWATPREIAKLSAEISHEELDPNEIYWDMAEAVRWYKMAADQGHAEAMMQLGRIYENGEGVPKERATALVWYHSAHVAGWPGAFQELQRVLSERK